MYFTPSQNDHLLDQQDRQSPPHSPLPHEQSQHNQSQQSQQQQSHGQSITGKRKAMDKEPAKNAGFKTIDPLSLMSEDAKSFSFKRQRLDSVNSADFSIPLTTNDESFTSSYVFLHSTVSRPASSAQGQNTPSVYSSYQGAPQEEERILREEFFSQMSPGFLSSGGQSGSFGSLAGYGLSPYHPAASAPSPYMLPSFAPPMMQNPQVPPHYNNGWNFSPMGAAPPEMYYPREQAYSRPPAYPQSTTSSSTGMPSTLPEEFIAETKLSKNIKKMTTVLGQIPGLEKIRWQSILQGTRSPDVGERETQRRVKEAETIGARLFGGDIDKLLGSILNQHLDFLVTYVANLKNGKKKHNKIRMQLSKVLQDTASNN